MSAEAVTAPVCDIIFAIEPNDYADAKALMIEYREIELGDDRHIGGSQLDEELEKFPGPYCPPTGILLLAKINGRTCGCLALRPFSLQAGEVMRMYVKEAARGKGLAEMLMRTLIERARSIGYRELYLDSLKRFTAAHRLYEKLGFDYCPPYDPGTTADMKQHMVFMRRAL